MPSTISRDAIGTITETRTQQKYGVSRDFPPFVRPTLFYST